MDGLQSKLYPDGLSFIQAREKFYHILFQAVWTGADGKRHNPWMGNGFRENPLQIRNRSIGIGICLEIGNIFVDWTLGGQHFNLAVNLPGDGKGCACGEISAAPFTAENTAAVPDGAVPVGTAHASVQCNLVNLFPEPFPQHIVKGMIGLAVPVIHRTSGSWL